MPRTARDQSATGIYHVMIRGINRQDHLGNIRAVVNHDGSVEQRNHYYPFGAIYGDLAYNDGLQKYKYNGKELDRMHGLNFYDYGARQYDPLLGMFTQMDPLAEKYYGVNPYAYCGNNPINAIDPNGKEKIEVLDPAKIKNQDLIEAASNFKDEKYVINIWAHGSSKGMTVYDKDKGKSVEITNTKDFKNFLNRYSKVWINRKEGEQVKIVLHSCETGKSIKGEENFAQKISSDLSNTVVVAPNRNVYTRNGHEIGTYNEAIETQGVSSNYEGRWVQYEEGKQSTTYRGSSLPGSAGYRYVTSNSPWYIKVLNFRGIK